MPTVARIPTGFAVLYRSLVLHLTRLFLEAMSRSGGTTRKPIQPLRRTKASSVTGLNFTSNNTASAALAISSCSERILAELARLQELTLRRTSTGANVLALRGALFAMFQA